MVSQINCAAELAVLQAELADAKIRRTSADEEGYKEVNRQIRQIKRDIRRNSMKSEDAE